MNVYQWYRDNPDKWSKVTHLTNSEEIQEAFTKAEISMGTLNLRGARMMKRYAANAATDVTGFGILGHAEYLS